MSVHIDCPVVYLYLCPLEERLDRHLLSGYGGGAEGAVKADQPAVVPADTGRQTGPVNVPGHLGQSGI